MEHLIALCIQYAPFILYFSIFPAFFLAVHFLLRFLAKRNGFRKMEIDHESMGPVLFFYRWGSVRIGGPVYGRNVRITGYKDYIHLKLMWFFGGGEILLPMKDASFEFSSNLWGIQVDVTVDGEEYGFGRNVAAMVKKHYR